MQSNLKQLAKDNADLIGHVDLCKANAIPRYDPSRIIRCVCEYFHVTEAELKGERSFMSLRLPRFAAVLLLRESGKGWTEIGTLLNRDHTTILYASKESLRRRNDDEVFDRQLTEIEKIVRDGFNA